MSKYSNFDTKFRSYSPKHPTDPTNLYEQHRELIHNQISQLPNSPRSKTKIEQTFDEMLKSIHFFRKPDIIPFPFLNLDRPAEEPAAPPDTRYKELLEELERERNLRKAAERENETLKEKLLYLTDIESQYEEYRLKSLKLSELMLEIEKLNAKMRILLDENEELRRKLRGGYENSANAGRMLKDLEREKENSTELARQLNELKQAYDDLRRAYAKDVNTQKERYEKIYDEKIQLEVRLREVRDRFGKIQEPSGNVDDEIQARIRSMKHEYKDKLKQLEKRLDPEKPKESSEGRLKEIEDRLANLQGKLADQAARSRPRPGSQTSRGSTPTKERNTPTRERNTPKKEKNSPQSTWRTGSGLSPDRLQSAKPEKLTRPPARSKSPGQASGSKERSPSRGRTSRSPGRTTFSASGKSPLRTSSSPLTRHRLYEQHHECETCVRRHGHEWAKSPGKS